MKTHGFSIIEIIVAISVFCLLAGLGLPIGLDSFRSYALASETRNLLNILRRAESFAMANSYESDFGVALDGERLVVFKGSSFASRDEVFDEPYPISSRVIISGLTEVIFSAISGMPYATSTISLSINNNTQTILINEYGAFFWS